MLRRDGARLDAAAAQGHVESQKVRRGGEHALLLRREALGVVLARATELDDVVEADAEPRANGDQNGE